MILTVALALLGCPEARQQTKQPNVVLVMSDDQGLGDFSHAGHGVLATPNLDRLSATSPQVQRFYVSPVCSPTRACLMTGRYNYRTRVVDTWVGRSMMEPDEVTVAEILSAAGYATGIFGKWHLGDCYPLRPIDQGFEVALVHRGGGLAQPSEPPENAGRYTDAILLRNGSEVQTQGYCTDVYFSAALRFIDASLEQERPFFAYVATNAPHGPYGDVPTDLYEKYAESELEPTLRGKSDKVEREARICAMVENIDQNVGRLLAHLEQRGIAEDTLFIFLNDNGPVAGRYTRGLRGSKTSVYEGGIRAPLFVRWPGHLSPTTEVDSCVAHIDILPTILAATGVPLPSGLQLDGRNLLPLLQGEKTNWSERKLFFQTHRGNTPELERHFAVVGQRWKLVRASGFGRHDPDQPFELFDLQADPAETKNLAAENPERVAALRAAYADWFQDVSSTRPDNYAPPRIVVGSLAEKRTVLTKQDRYSQEGEGWGNDGAWLLHADSPTELEVVLLFTEPTTVETARIYAGAQTIERRVEASGSEISLGNFKCPSGGFDFRVETSTNAGAVSVHQVVLRRP